MLAKPSILRRRQQQGSHQTHPLFGSFFSTRVSIVAKSKRSSACYLFASGNRQQAQKHTSQNATEERSNHRNWRIAPIRAAFPGNGKNGVRGARPEVACRVDRVSGRSP